MVDRDVTFESLLEKETGVFKKKTNVWVVLDTVDVSFYRPEKRSSCIGSVKISDILSVRKITSEGGSQFEIQTDSKTFLFNATDAELADKWVSALQLAITRNSAKSANNGSCDSNSPMSTLTDTSCDTDYNSNMNLASTTNIFGVQLKPSIRNSKPSIKRQSDIDTVARQSLLQTDVASDSDKQPKNHVDVKVMSLDHSVNGQADIASAQIPTRVPPPPPQRKESLLSNNDDETKSVPNKGVRDKPIQLRRGPPSFKPPPPPTTSVGLNMLDTAASKDIGQSFTVESVVSGVSDTDIPRDNSDVFNKVVGEGGTGSDGPEEHEPKTKANDDVFSDSKHSTTNLDSTATKEDVQMRKDTGNATDIKLREKVDESDIDISGVEMRRSRRSNRNNSVNNSSARSIRSIDSRTDDNAKPNIRVDEVQDEDASAEMFNLESVLGSILSKGPNGLSLEKQGLGITSLDRTLDSEACIRLKKFLKEITAIPFDVSNHKVSTENSVELLRGLLHD